MIPVTLKWGHPVFFGFFWLYWGQVANFTQSRSGRALCQAARSSYWTCFLLETAIRLCRPFAAIDCGEFVAASFHVSQTTRDEMCSSNTGCKCRLSDLPVPPSPSSAQDRCSVWLSDTEHQSWWKCTQVWKRNLWLFTRAAGLQSSLSAALHLCSHSQLVWGSGKGTSMTLNH